MKDLIKLIISIMIIFTVCQAQVAEYYFKQQNLAYTEISGGTLLWSGTFDNDVSGAITIPSFTYDGTAYTSLYISANGFITFGLAPAGTNYTPISNSATYNGAISGFGRDLNQAASGSPAIRYEQVGNEFVIQWKDVRRKDIASEIISFQVRLNTSNNYISVIYGGTITPGTYTTYPQVGLRGPDDNIATNVHNRTIAAGGTNWINSIKGTGSANTMYFNFATPATVPTAGLTYTWKPLYNPIGFTAEAVSQNQIDLDWLKNSLNHNVMLAYNTNSTFGTPISGTTYTVTGTIGGGGTVLVYGDATSYTHASLSANTRYYYKIWSYDAVPDYSIGDTVSARTAIGLPYLQDFSGTSAAGWSYNMTLTANHGTAGSKGLTEHLTAGSAFAITPLIGSMTASTNLSFHYRIVNDLGYPLNATTLGPSDKIEIQVSLDDGATFTTIHTIDQYNHTVSTEFANKVISLSAYNGDFIKIKFLSTWGSGDYWVDFDNVLFEDGTNMSYSGSTTDQFNFTNVAINSTDNEIIRLQVVTQKSSNPLSVTSITFNATGSTSATNDIAVAKVYYTTTPTFSTATLYGTYSNPPNSPTTFNITGSQALAQGNNYFWLAYDIKPGATAGNLVDAQCTKFITSESGSDKIPTVTTITGNRKIGAVITGPKSIPGDYATIALAVTALNNGVLGSGGVTFNVAAGHTESSTAAIVLTQTGTSADPIIFQKSGSGANPLVTHSGAGSVNTTNLGYHGDGVIIIEGADYVTFDAIDVTASNSGVEYGYYLRKASVTNGCKNVTVKNANITLTKGTSEVVVGFCAANNSSSASNIAITTTGGIHDAITFTGNIISNTFCGIYLMGNDNLKDQNFIIGTNGFGNTIRNFAGNSANPSYGIYLKNNDNSLVRYNTINNMTGGGSAFTAAGSGIYHASTDEVDFTAEYNNINLTSVSSQLYGSYIAVSGELQLNNNTIALSNTSASTAIYAFIYNNQTSTTSTNNIYINSNIFAASNFQTTGTTYLILNTNPRPQPSVASVQNNTISGTISRTGTSGNFYLYYNASGTGTGTENISGNNFSDIVLSGSSTFNGIYSTTRSNHTQNIYNNTISNISCGSGNFGGIYVTTANNRSIYGNDIYNITGGGALNGIYLGSGSDPGHIYNNEIYNLSTSSTSTSAGILNGIQVAAGTNIYLYNNFISDLKTPSAPNFDAIRGIAITPGQSNSTVGLYYNSIYLNATSSGTNFGTTGIYHISNTEATFAKLDLRNNLIINNSTPNGSAQTVAFRRSAQTTANFATTSNNNIFYAGTPASNRLIYLGNSAKQTIEEYRDFMGPTRDSISFSELPPFINTTTAPYNLRLQDGTTNYCESGAQSIISPITISDDFDGATRPSTPDIGADEFSGTSIYVEIPASLTAVSLNSQQIKLEFDSNPDEDDVVIVYSNTKNFTNPSVPPIVGQPLANGTVLSIGTTSPVIHSGLDPADTVYYKAFCYNESTLYYSLGISAKARPVVTPVTNFTAVCGGQDQIGLGWTKNINNHDVIISVSNAYMNDNPANGTNYNVGESIPSAGTVIYKGPASGYNHGGLDSWTQYYYKAWSVDIFNYYSSGVSKNAITDADPVTEFGYAQNFDGTWAHDPLAPTNWLVVDVGGSGSFTWIRNSIFKKSSPYSAQGYGSGACNDYLISPPLELPDTLVQLTWWDKVSVSSNINNYKVLLSTTTNLVSSFTTELIDITCSNTTWQQHTLNLSAYKGQTVYIAFYQYYTSQQYQTFAIDDIVIESLVPGAALLETPEDELRTFIDPTLKWKVPVSSLPILSYKVYLDTSPNPTTLVYEGANLSFQPAALAYNTTYYWKVVPANANGEAYDIPVWSFSTVTSSQLAQSFEADYFPPVSWNNPNGGWFLSATSAYHGLKSVSRFSYNTSRPLLITPLLDIETGDKLEFFEGTSSKINNYMVVCYSADKIDWDTIGDILDITIGSWGQRSFDLSSLAGSQYYFAFNVWCAPGNYNTYVYIDHVIGPEVVPILPWAATNPEPFDGEAYLPLNPVLYWAPQIWGGIPAGYKVYMDTNPNPTTLVYNGLREYYQTGPLLINTTYYWKVVPYNSLGDALDIIVWSFTTVPVGGVQIGRGLETYYDLPVYTDYGYNYSQTIYLQSEINISGKLISKIYYQWNGEEEGTRYKDWVIYMGHTTKEEFTSNTDWVPLAQLTQVFAGEVIIPYNDYDPVWVEIILETPFDYNNTDNLVIAIDENTDGYSDSYGPAFYCTEDQNFRSILYSSDDDNPDPASPPEADDFIEAFPDIRILCELAPTTPIFFSNPASKNFGVVEFYTSSDPCVFNIRNRGIGTLTLTSAGLGGTNSDQFQLTDNNVYPVALAADDYVPVTVTFIPDSEGIQTAYITVNHDAAGSPAVISLSGTGFDPTIHDFPFVETFEDGSLTRNQWTQIIENGYNVWGYGVGNSGSITDAHGDWLNAVFPGLYDDSAKLVSPPLNLSSVTSPQLTFWYGNEALTGNVNNFRVYYRTSPVSSWVELFFDNADVPEWTEVTLSLPDPSSSYQVAFESALKSGYFTVVDDVRLGSPAAPSTTWTGNVSDYWFDPANWTNGVPGDNHEVIINTEMWDPVIDFSVTVHGITIEPGSFITVTPPGVLTVTGN